MSLSHHLSHHLTACLSCVGTDTHTHAHQVETCQKALVLLRPTAFTVERVTLAKHLQGIGRSFTNEPPPFPSARDSLKAFAASLR